MERKEFIKKFALGGSILLTAPVIFSACSSDDEELVPNTPGNTNEITIDLTAASSADLATVGGYIYSGNLIVFRTGDNSYKALSKSCTHQNCPVVYNHAAGNLPCTCHGSKFTTTGTVTTGPATTNLQKFTVVKDGDSLKIS